MSATPAGDWDMTAWFPEFDGEVYRAFRRQLAADTATLQDELAASEPLTVASAARWAARLARLEEVSSRHSQVGQYLSCLGAADSAHEAVTRETASAAAAYVELDKCFTLVHDALKAADDAAFGSLLGEPALAGAGYFLERMRRRAAFRMDRELEMLASELDLDGMSAWGRLYDRISGTLEFELAVPGHPPERRPIAHTRSLLQSPDASVRRAALEGANAAWEQLGDVAAACLNGIAGARHTLYRRRGVEHFLDPALFDAGIERATLEVLLDTVERRAGIARRYLERKAELLGREQLGFQDLAAPLPPAEEGDPPASLDWGKGCDRIVRSFEAFYPALGRFAADAIASRWVDYSPRPGKRPGGFCSTSTRVDESRIFMTYNDTLGDVFTLAHELGHAFHGRVMSGMRSWARRYPMTLAETASTFAEQLVIDAVLEDPGASPRARAEILDSRMLDAATFLLDIPTRFHFEHAFYEERQHGEVSVGRLKQLMLTAQRRCYGDALAADELNPWFWASKLHFFITGVSFYNFPYTFGYLFSLGICARAKAEGASFLPRYEALLRRTGSDTAENVAREALGVDLQQPDFWNASIDSIEADFERYEQALGSRHRSPGANRVSG
jgi:oligoendopeptidase F